MPTIQIRNVSEQAYRVMRTRAAQAGQSLQEYMRAEVERMANRRAISEILAEARRDIESDPLARPLSADEIVKAIEDGRRERDQELGLP